MKLITSQRLQELEDAKRLLEINSKEEVKLTKSYQRQLARATQELKEDFEDDLDEERQESRKIVKELEGRIETAKEKAAEAVKAAEGKVTAAQAVQKTVEAERDALKKLVTKNGDLITRELELDNRKTELDVKVALMERTVTMMDEQQREIVKSVKENAEAVAAAREEGNKIGEMRGYANGIADGVREVAEITQEANTNVMKMADKAQDALVKAATKDIPQPTINMVPLETTVNNSTTKVAKK